ncbi:MAG TPA: succinate dehydrogenase iron-sulfur subunit [Phycisphaerae bacterium]|nr:succinate dehydrogenase iron-sulfur subunit [Phycisphaerales bacterium]HRX84064.1 succinate dehydrogenase iron-sulfur subunit [Phycisphaerae bacterium]
MAQDVIVHIQRKDSPDGATYRQTFHVPYEDGMNITTVLQRISAQPVTDEGEHTAPVAYDACCLEEVCGACTMVINGHVRQACSALVDNLLKEQPEITLEPMTKFPVVRDLLVDRSRLFNALKRSKAWVSVDGYWDRGSGPLMAPRDQEEAYPLSRCMSCGCCLEACPQYNDKEDFIGPHAVSQIVLYNTVPAGQSIAPERLDVLAGPGGIAACGNAQNCVKVCPKEIPLTTSIAKAGRAATGHAIRRWFRR